MVVMMYVGHTLDTPAYRSVGMLSGAPRLRVLLIHRKLNYSLLVRYALRCALVTGGTGSWGAS